MRALILVAAASLTMSACGTKPGADNAVTTSDNLAAEAIIANDTTAIDAATGDAANMAADVDYSINLTDSDASAVAKDGKTSTRSRPSGTPTENSDDEVTPADETAVDSNGA
jgi:hypothetical protein